MVLFGLSAFVVSNAVYSIEKQKQVTITPNSNTPIPKKYRPQKRFQKDGPSSVLFQQWTEDDSSAMEIEYSFKYIVYRCDYAFDHEKNLPKPQCGSNSDETWQDEYYFAYTGKFDFYVEIDNWGGRKSSPVVNRVSNPSFHWRTYPKSGSAPFGVEWIDISFEHRSDGQVTEIDERDDDPGSDTFDQLLTQIAYDNEDYAYFDGLSRGSNYFKISTVKRQGGGDSDADECAQIGECASYRLSVKIYVSQDTNVNWGPNANSGISIADYDVVRLGYSNQFNPPIFSWRPVMNVSAEYTFGKDLWETDSLDIGIALPDERFNGFKLPWYIKMHFGPMNSLSNYTKSQMSIGFGVLFTD